MLLTLHQPSESHGALFITQIFLGSSPRVPHSEGLGGAREFAFYKFPGDAKAADIENPL